MLKAIKAFFDTHANEELQETQQNNQLAVAALLIEIMIADDHIDHAELATLKQFLIEFLNLPEIQVDEIIHLARTSAESSNDVYQFTRVINDQFDYDERCEIIKGLWQLAYADQKIDKYEEYTVRKISDLLYLRQKDFIQAKLSAKNQSTSVGPKTS